MVSTHTKWFRVINGISFCSSYTTEPDEFYFRNTLWMQAFALTFLYVQEGVTVNIN